MSSPIMLLPGLGYTVMTETMLDPSSTFCSTDTDLLSSKALVALTLR